MSEYPTRIEPDLGVRVLTPLGFAMREADREGRTLAEELEAEARLLQDMEAEFLAQWHDPAYVLAAARHAARELNRSELDYARTHPDERPDLMPVPRRVLRVLHVEGGCGVMGHKVKVRAVATQAHGVRGVLVVEDSYEHGASYYDPPEGESVTYWDDDVEGEL